MDARFDVILPGIGGVGQLLAHPVKDDVHIIIDEDRLDISNHVQLLEAADLLLVGDLAVDDAVAGMEIGHLLPGALDGVEAHFHRAVADGVHDGGHVVLMSLHYQVIQLFLRLVDGQTPGRGVIGIGLAHISGAGTQGAVGQDLDGRDLEGAVAVAVIQLFLVKELGDLVRRGEEGLLGQAELEIALFALVPHETEHLKGMSVGDVLNVIRLDRGDAVSKHVVLGLDQHVHQLADGGGGQRFLDVVKDILFHHAVGGTVFISFGIGTVFLDALLVQTQDLHGLGVHDAHVEAGPHDEDGVFGGDGVQIPAVGEAALVGEIVMVPALAGAPQTALALVVVFKEMAHPVDDLFQRSRTGQIGPQLGLDIMQIMHVAGASCMRCRWLSLKPGRRKDPPQSMVSSSAWGCSLKYCSAPASVPTKAKKSPMTTADCAEGCSGSMVAMLAFLIQRDIKQTPQFVKFGLRLWFGPGKSGERSHPGPIYE